MTMVWRFYTLLLMVYQVALLSIKNRGWKLPLPVVCRDTSTVGSKHVILLVAHIGLGIGNISFPVEFGTQNGGVRRNKGCWRATRPIVMQQQRLLLIVIMRIESCV
eukprot:scaffold23069_cov79-Attheya_sp.AAC.6